MCLLLGDIQPSKNDHIIHWHVVNYEPIFTGCEGGLIGPLAIS